MTISAIQERAATEAKLFDLAKQIRALLDEAAGLELPDGRDAEEEAIELATAD